MWKKYKHGMFPLKWLWFPGNSFLPNALSFRHFRLRDLRCSSTLQSLAFVAHLTHRRTGCCCCFGGSCSEQVPWKKRKRLRQERSLKIEVVQINIVNQTRSGSKYFDCTCSFARAVTRKNATISNRLAQRI